VAAPRQPMPALSAAALGDVPTVVLVGGALLSGIYWITERRNEVAMVEAREKSVNHEGH
jgi:formate dehydrogenase iron-sulfur subunit